MNDCEFCDELKGAPSRFRAIYAPEHASRIVATSQHFVAMPTLGQLFPGSLLVVLDRTSRHLRRRRQRAGPTI